MSHLPPDPVDVERRVPVWHALSELFLDAEPRPHDFDRIAVAIAAAAYGRAAARAILDNEVAPVFAVNLLSVAGEWMGWSSDSVRDAVVAAMKQNRFSRWRARLRARAARRIYLASWQEIERRLPSSS